MPARLSTLLVTSLSLGMLILSACGSSNNANKAATAAGSGSSNTTNVSSQSNAATGQQSAAGKPLADCAYANQVVAALLAIGAGGSDSTTIDKGSVTAIVSSANQSLSALKAISPPTDFKQFHADFVKAIQDVVNQMQDAQKSIDAGDATKAQASLTGAEAGFGKQIDSLQAKYPAQSKRLDACPSPTP